MKYEMQFLVQVEPWRKCAHLVTQSNAKHRPTVDGELMHVKKSAVRKDAWVRMFCVPKQQFSVQ